MPNYRAPGVYIEEISAGPRPIEAVGTSTAGFVGIAPNPGALQNKWKAVNNWSEFCRLFADTKNVTSTPLSQAVFGYFLNGGSRCYVVNLGPEAESIAGSGRERRGIDVLEEVDEVAVVAAPGFTDAASYEALLNHCEKLKDRVAVLDAPETVSNIEALTKFGAITLAQQKKGGADIVAANPPIVDLRPRVSDGGYGAFYFPWIVVRDPFSGKNVAVPPSGHIAGIYARNDATRGVHKAPANEIVNGALGVVYPVTYVEQELLNTAGVNCIRLFSNEGVRVWGARTVASSNSEWRYLNVRRLFNMIEESISKNTRWVIFEPNAMPLWKAIRRDVSAFLTLCWRQGALLGQTPEEAFFVQCDEETTPPELIDAGRVEVLIGIAAVKPAEFLVFKIGQGTGGTQVESPGQKDGGVDG